VDKEARIIFGAVQDERLRKGEIKVTVIASGFPNGFARSISLFNQEAQLLKGEGLGQRVPVSSDEGKEVPGESQEWDSVPAFLRRSKKI